MPKFKILTRLVIVEESEVEAESAADEIARIHAWSPETIHEYVGRNPNAKCVEFDVNAKKVAD